MIAKFLNILYNYIDKEVYIMGFPLLISFVALVLGVISWICSFYCKKKYNYLFDSLTGLFLGAGIMMWILAIAMKDPITDLISRDAQLIIAGLSFGGVTWKYYFDPMKKRIGNLEIGQGEIQKDIENIKSDTHLIKERVINGKIKFKK